MKRILIVAAGCILLTGVGLRLTEPDAHSEVPVLYWVIDPAPARSRQIHAYHMWLIENGYCRTFRIRDMQDLQDFQSRAWSPAMKQAIRAANPDGAAALSPATDAAALPLVVKVPGAEMRLDAASNDINKKIIQGVAGVAGDVLDAGGGGKFMTYLASAGMLAALFLAYMAGEAYNMEIVHSGDALPPNPEYTRIEAFRNPPDFPNEWGCHGAFADAANSIGIAPTHSPFILSLVLERIDNECLFADAHFLQSLRNTLFLMMGIPVGVGGSLCAALLLSGGGQRRGRGVVLAGAGMCVGCMLLLLSGTSLTPLSLLIYGVAALTLAGGFLGGNTVYRTLFYFPHFTAGVATFLLWKKLYDQNNGPINAALRGPLALLGARVSTLPPAVVHGGSWLAVCVAIGVAWLAAWRTHHSRRQGETGPVPLVIVAGMLYLPLALAMYWGGVSTQTWTLQVGGLLAALWLLVVAGRPTGFPCPRDAGLGCALITNAVAMVGIFACVGMTFVFTRLHGWAMDGLEPPNWLTQYHWAKPALMTLIALSLVLPFVWMVLTSLKPLDECGMSAWIPSVLQWHNYSDVFAVEGLQYGR